MSIRIDRVSERLQGEESSALRFGQTSARVSDAFGEVFALQCRRGLHTTRATSCASMSEISHELSHVWRVDDCTREYQCSSKRNHWRLSNGCRAMFVSLHWVYAHRCSWKNESTLSGILVQSI